MYRYAPRGRRARITRNLSMVAAGGLVAATLGCAGSDADALGIAATCQENEDCAQVTIDGEEIQLSCLTEFKDGYCGIEGCLSDADCPADSSCVAHDDGNNYCFRECEQKAECNANRAPDSEANCSSNFEYADNDDAAEKKKACIPPSGTETK